MLLMAPWKKHLPLWMTHRLITAIIPLRPARTLWSSEQPIQTFLRTATLTTSKKISFQSSSRAAAWRSSKKYANRTRLVQMAAEIAMKASVMLKLSSKLQMTTLRKSLASRLLLPCWSLWVWKRKSRSPTLKRAGHSPQERISPSLSERRHRLTQREES